MTMNVDRMRRTLERSRALAARREHVERVKSMTPEHRRHHEGRLPLGFCPVCLAESMRTAMRESL